MFNILNHKGNAHQNGTKSQASVILATWDAEIRRIVVWGQPRQFVRHNLQTNHRKMDLKCDSSSTVPALQAQSPEFKSHSHLFSKKSAKLSLKWHWDFISPQPEWLTSNKQKNNNKSWQGRGAERNSLLVEMFSYYGHDYGETTTRTRI
jgi:hypothetical protein